ncbi:ECF transporter S component [Paenibacillus nicotianae]|uniref:ECF transporter S component n=1 Tax=Paenibacillus nicotianae TaxID=1526551 RepID=A0ABW4V076_9BACL
MARSRLWLMIAVGLSILVLALSNAVLSDHYMLLSFVLLLAVMLPLFVRFERRKLEARELVLLAMLAAIAAVSRIPFAALPSVKPVSAIVILSALVFGSEAGFIVGAMAALVSNIYFGQGPWTPWQMFAWGMMGVSAGLLRHTWWMKKRLGLLTFGLIWGFLFGWIMNLWVVIDLAVALEWKAVLAVYVQSFYFDLAHALSNVFFLAILAGGWIKVLERFRKKYGLLDSG